MASTKARPNDRLVQTKALESPREMTHDVAEYLVDYARQNPGYAALYCLGIGFILGWKLKPW